MARVLGRIQHDIHEGVHGFACVSGGVQHEFHEDWHGLACISRGIQQKSLGFACVSMRPRRHSAWHSWGCAWILHSFQGVFSIMFMRVCMG